MAEMNVNIYMKRDYVENHALEAAKNKAKQTQCAVQAEPAQTIPIPIHDNRDEAATQDKVEKTKPICRQVKLAQSLF